MQQSRRLTIQRLGSGIASSLALPPDGGGGGGGANAAAPATPAAPPPASARGTLSLAAVRAALRDVLAGPPCNSSSGAKASSSSSSVSAASLPPATLAFLSSPEAWVEPAELGRACEAQPAEFAALPRWQQAGLLRKLGLAVRLV